MAMNPAIATKRRMGTNIPTAIPTRTNTGTDMGTERRITVTRATATPGCAK